MSAKKILLYAPLLAWYLNQGLKLTAVYRTIDYEPREIFSWFVNEVANNRRKGDAEKDKALLAEVFKLLGNSAYGKFIEAVERHTNTIYTRDEEEVDKSLRSARFKTLEEIGPAYKVELRRARSPSTGHSKSASWSTSSRSYECSSLLRVPGLLPRPEGLRAHPDGHRQHVLRSIPREARGRHPSWVRAPVRGGKEALAGLEQVEQPRARFYSSSRRRPPVVSHFAASATTWRTRLPARRRCPPRESTSGRTRCVGSVSSGLLRAIGTWWVNRGFRMRDGAMYTYEQRKLGLSAYYDKRWVLPDGIHTEPLEYHQ